MYEDRFGLGESFNALVATFFAIAETKAYASGFHPPRTDIGFFVSLPLLSL